jgi:preprotein translocase subunit YajC
MLNSLRRGDRVVTNGGLIATVTKIVSDGEIQLEIADDIRVRHVRGMIAEVLAKTDPVTPSASSPSQTSSPIVRKLESSKSKGSNKSAANRSKGKAKK